MLVALVIKRNSFKLQAGAVTICSVDLAVLEQFFFVLLLQMTWCTAD